MLTMGLLAIAAVGSANASVITFNLDTVVTGDTPNGPSPWLTATFTDSGADEVTLKLMANYTGGDFLKGQDGPNTTLGWGFNLADTAPSLVFSDFDCTGGNCANGINTTANGAGDSSIGYFDVTFGWLNKSGDEAHFGAGDSATYTITAAGLDAIDFLATNGSPYDYYSGAHVQGTSGPAGSGKIAATTPSISVPEPAGWALFALGLTGVIAVGFGRSRNSR